MLSTLPGLPMFGHGQIEGFTERYGMEFKRARMEEHPNEGLIGGHQYHIAPLLKNRALFAESANFVLYDFWTDSGTVDENVFAYSNRLNDQRALILYNNRYGNTHGTIHISAASMDKGSGQLQQRSLSEGLGIPDDGSVIFAFRDTARGLEYLRRATDLVHHGLTLDLRGYQYVVLLHWRELRSTADQPWDRLCDALHGGGVHSVDEALLKLRLRPLHDALHQAINTSNVHLFAKIASEPVRKAVEDKGTKPATAILADEAAESSELTGKRTSKIPEPCVSPDTVDPRLGAFIEKSQLCFRSALEILSTDSGDVNLTSSEPDPALSYRKACEAMTMAALRLPCLERIFSTDWPPAVRYTLPSNEPGGMLEQTWTPALAWIVLRSFPARGVRVALFDKLQLRSALAEIFSSLGLEGERAWRAAAQIRVLLLQADTPSASIDSAEFWADPDVRWLAGVNQASGKTYVNKEQFEELLCWLQLPALLEIAPQDSDEARAIRGVEAVVSSACRAAEEARYNLETYLSLLKDEHESPSLKDSKSEAPRTS